MSLTLFELCGEDRSLRFSPPVWTVKYVLAFKGVAYESHPLRFLEKSPIEASGQGALPVLADGERQIADSFEIAKYLDQHFDGPKLFASEAEIRAQHFWRLYAATHLQTAIFKCIAMDIYRAQTPEDGEYFKRTREAKFGQSFESFETDRAIYQGQFVGAIQPMIAAKATAPYFGGAEPSHADFVLAGLYIWNRLLSPVNVFAAEPALAAWCEAIVNYADIPKHLAGMSFR